MLKRNSGSIMVGVVLVSAALAVLMVSLITMSRYEVRKGESLLAKESLRRMVEEKFTRDLLALRQAENIVMFSSAPVTLPLGEAQSFVQVVPASLPQFSGGIFIVVTATVTRESSGWPRHLKVETIVAWPHTGPRSHAPAPIPYRDPRKTLEQHLEDRISEVFPDADSQLLAQLKASVMESMQTFSAGQLKEMEDMFETNVYRGPSENSEVKLEQGAFVMSPLTITSEPIGPSIQMWKETY